MISDKVNRADRADGGDDFFRERRPGIRILFVNIKAGRFPVLVQAEIKIKLRLPLQPGDVRANLGGFWVAIIAVQIRAIGVLAPVRGEAGGVQAGQQKNLRVLRPAVFWSKRNAASGPAGSSPWMPVLM
jgi:hypothetical protein